jgi:hypothetical protein
MRVPSRWRFWVAGAALGISCQAALGIEDLDEQPRPIAAGAGSGGGTAMDPVGDPEGNAGAAADGAAGSGGSRPGLAGASSGGAGTEPVGDDGDLPDAATPDPNDAPDAGPPVDPGTLTVTGQVIDFFRRPVPNVPVDIAGQTTVTDAQGNFSIGGVEPPYDVALMLIFMRDNVPARYGYVYEGLTRDDPTLQVYSALVQRASSSFDVTIENGEFDEDAGRRVILAFSSPDGRFVDESVTSDAVSFVGGIQWTGPTTISGNAHALRVLDIVDDDGNATPIYESHQATALSAEDGEVAAVSFDMQPGDVPSDVIAGEVSGGPLGERSNYVAVRFDDGTALPLIDESSTDESFTFIVPALDDTSLVVAAADGLSGVPPYALAWQDGISVDDVNISLDIPNPVTPTAPQIGASVDADTTFSWSTAGQTATTFLWHLESNSPTAYEGMLVVTTRTTLELPTFFDGFTILPGTSFVWSVETHGDAPDVDALTGQGGFLDPFSVSSSFPVGPGRGGGYYTESARSFAEMSED